ncbi:MAG: ketoacyl-ACP synthase III [Rickettsiales bacterium]|jgi:3-oxoacyl-[acyl-carrier-protein] synthase-3|nr:ketoacyl-ACP synthase III [Rickettsiales bacterium]
MGNKLAGYGIYLPERVVSNDELSRVMDTSDEWISTRTGIKQRHWARHDEAVADMALAAALEALENSRLEPGDLDMIICANCTAELQFPSVAAMTHGRLGCPPSVAAFDVRGACTGAIYALHAARAFFEAEMHRRIMVIGAEKLSKMVDLGDRNTAVLFGDGAGAMIFEACVESGGGILDTAVFADGKFADILCATGDGKIRMNGPELYKKAVVCMPEAAAELLKRNGLGAGDIDWVVPHQANIRIMQSAAERLGIDGDRLIATVGQHANTSAASGLLAMGAAISGGKMKRGDLAIYPAFGSGLTWGAALIRI